VFSFWPSLSLLIFFLAIFLECRAIGARVTLPLKSFLLFFGYGCIGAPLLALLLQQIPLAHFDVAGGASLSAAAWFTAPPIEEFAKAFPILVLAFFMRESRRLSIADLTLAGFASGAGFGFVEANLKALANGAPASFEHLSGFGFETAQRIATDYVVNFAGHPIYPALIGLAAGAALRFIPDRRELSWIPAFCVFLVASFDHGMFNWKTLAPASELGGFPVAPLFVELLYAATLHGKLEIWLLPIALVAAQIVESWLCAKAAGRRPDLLLRFELGPWALNEWVVALSRIPAGRAAFFQTLGYFRRRRAFALAMLESKRYPNERSLARHARFLELRLKRERQILRDPPRGVWLPPRPILKHSLKTWAWRTRWVLAFGVLFFLLFMLGEDQLPHSLRQFLFGRIFTAVVVALGLGFAGWGIFRLWRAPRPDPVATETADYLGYHARLFLLGASLASGVFPALSLILGWKALVPGAAYLSSYLPGWIGQGGNPNTLMGLGAMGGSVEWDVNPTSEALRHEVTTGEERIRKLERQIEANIPASGGAAPFERELGHLLDLITDLDGERDAHEQRKLALDEAERQAAERSGEDPALAVQAVKEEFQRLDREVGAAAADQLARIAAFEKAYAHGWAEIMAVLDAADAKRAEIAEPLKGLWRARKDTAWALRIAAIQDETVLPSLALLLPELEASAGEAENETGGHLRAAIDRIRGADRIIEEPIVADVPEEIPVEQAVETASEIEAGSDSEPSGEEWLGGESEMAIPAVDEAEAVPQLDLFAQPPAAEAPQLRPAVAVLPRVEDGEPEQEEYAEADERPSRQSELNDDSFYDLESVAPRPYDAVLPSYARLLEKVSDFLRVQVHQPLADDIDAIDALDDDDLDVGEEDAEPSAAPDTEQHAGTPAEPVAETAHAEPTAVVDVGEPEPPRAVQARELEAIAIAEAAQPEIPQVAAEPVGIEVAQPELSLSHEVSQPEERSSAQIAAPEEKSDFALVDDAFVIATSESKSEPAGELPPVAVAEVTASAEPPPAVSVRPEEPPAPPIEPYVDKLDELGSDEADEFEGAGKLSHAEALLAEDDEGFEETPAIHQPSAADARKTIAPSAPKTASDLMVDAAVSYSYFGIVREFSALRAKLRTQVPPAPQPASEIAPPVPPVPELPQPSEAQPEPPAAIEDQAADAKASEPLLASESEIETAAEVRPRDWDWDVPQVAAGHISISVTEHTQSKDLSFAAPLADEAADAARAAKRAEEALDRLRLAMGPEPSNLSPATDAEVAECLAAQLQIPDRPPLAEATAETVVPKAETLETKTEVQVHAEPIVLDISALAPEAEAKVEAVAAELPMAVTPQVRAAGEIEQPVATPETKSASLRDIVHAPQPATPSLRDAIDRPRAKSEATPSLRDVVDKPRMKPEAAPSLRDVVDKPRAKPEAAPSLRDAVDKPRAKSEPAPSLRDAVQKPQAKSEPAPSLRDTVDKPRAESEPAPSLRDAVQKPQAKSEPAPSLRDTVDKPRTESESALSLRDAVRNPQAKSEPAPSLPAVPAETRAKPAGRSWFHKVADYFGTPKDAPSSIPADDENAYIPGAFGPAASTPARDTTTNAAPAPVESPKIDDNAPVTTRSGWDQYRDALDNLKEAIKGDGQAGAIRELHLAEHVTAGLRTPSDAARPEPPPSPDTTASAKPAVDRAQESRPAVEIEVTAVAEVLAAPAEKIVAAPIAADASFPTAVNPSVHEAISAPPTSGEAEVSVPISTATDPAPLQQPQYIDRLVVDIAAPAHQSGDAQKAVISVSLPETLPEISALAVVEKNTTPARIPDPPSVEIARADEKPVVSEQVIASEPIAERREAPAVEREEIAKAPDPAPAAALAQPRRRPRSAKRKDALVSSTEPSAQPEPPAPVAQPVSEIVDLKLAAAAPPSPKTESAPKPLIADDSDIIDLKATAPQRPKEKPAAQPTLLLPDDDIIDLKVPAAPPPAPTVKAKSQASTTKAAAEEKAPQLSPAAPPIEKAPVSVPPTAPKPRHVPAPPAVEAKAPPPLPQADDLSPSEQVRVRREYRNGLERMRVGVKIDETQAAQNGTGQTKGEPTPDRTRSDGSAEAPARAPLVKVGFDRKQPRRDFVDPNPTQKRSNGSAASSDPAAATGLASALSDYFNKLGKPQPPMHITDHAGLKKLANIGLLDAPYRNRATWSFSGMLAKGEVAIRLKPGAEKFIELVPSVETFGQVPHYYPRGVGNGDYRGTIPAEYLQYFDTQSRQWLAVKG
jgi:RsiW-degrading membrane proteinase PrsW (M82 family)